MPPNLLATPMRRRVLFTTLGAGGLYAGVFIKGVISGAFEEYGQDTGASMSKSTEPTPTKAPSPTPEQPKIASPTPVLPSVELHAVQFVCANHDHIFVKFRATDLPDGYRYTVWARPSGRERWYPSNFTVDEGGGVHTARVYIWQDPRFEVRVVVLDAAGTAVVKEYIGRRMNDLEWGQGMADLPPNSVSRANRTVTRTCS